jgi:hypothetical protein
MKHDSRETDEAGDRVPKLEIHEIGNEANDKNDVGGNRSAKNSRSLETVQESASG